MSNSLKLVSIKKLAEKKFHIAFYQRGYRWKEEQVRQLLDDLKDFQSCKAVPHYFLQVLICSQRGDNENELNVVDGQQRLTTINLILKAFNNSTTLSLECERDQKQNERGALDKHFIEIAEKTIRTWIENHSKDDTESIAQTLLDSEFLVYNLQKEDSKSIEAKENEVFDRINSGKISARDSELVKCVMLTIQSDEPTEVTQRRATEWDEIERSLNDEDFFAFLTPRNARNSDDRMTRIFIAAGYKPDNKTIEEYTFPYLATIQKAIKETKISRQAIWAKISNAFSRLQTWYRDNLTYHVIGWWIHRYKRDDGLKQINRLSDIWESLNKTFDKTKELDNIEDLYHEKPEETWDTLFLFSLAYACVRQHIRYDFRRHRGIDTWSLEHVKASNVRELSMEEFETYRKFASEPEKFSWDEYSLKLQEEAEEERKKKSEEYLSKMLTNEEYMEGEDDSLGNLALLGGNNNSSLGDEPFMAKRTIINEWDKDTLNGGFVPPATSAIFNKLFSDMDPLKPYLSESDKKAYIKAIQSICKQFVTAIQENIKQFETEGNEHA